MTINNIASYNDRVKKLESLFGNPWNSHNPLSFSAILDADEHDDMLKAGELMLDQYGLNAEFVPAEYGGRLEQMDGFIKVMRSIYRRDPCLGLGYGTSSFIAAVNIWAAGSKEQCYKAATLLLSNKKIACSYYELQHGNDLARIEFEAMPKENMLLLNGYKQVTTNLQRADAIVMFARTAKGIGSRNHSQIFLNKTDLPKKYINYLPRFKSVGMRGVQLGGMEFRKCPVSYDSILGLPGQALETAIKSFQLTRTALPGMFLGIVDTGLRVTLKFVLKRSLYGKIIADLPQVNFVLTNVFADLILCDCFSTVVARGLHTVPRASSIYAPAVKFLVPKILIDAMNQLANIMGANFYLRSGDYSIFQKLLRDLKPCGFGHVARVACLMTILPQLQRLARHSWLSEQAELAPIDTYQITKDLPPFMFKELGVSAGSQDPLMAGLMASVETLNNILDKQNVEHQSIFQLAKKFIFELNKLKNNCVKLSSQEMTVMASPSVYDLASHYSIILAASTCLSLWTYGKDQHHSFFHDPLCIFIILNRLWMLLGNKSLPLPERLSISMFSELLARYESSYSFDLFNSQLSM